MKTLLCSIFLTLALCVSAYAGCTFRTIGQTTYINCDDGTSGTANKIGGTTYYNFSDGSSGTSTSIGGTTYFNYYDSNGTYSGQ